MEIWTTPVKPHDVADISSQVFTWKHFIDLFWHCVLTDYDLFSVVEPEASEAPRLSLDLPAVWQALETDVQGADHGGLLPDGLIQITLSAAHQGRQSAGQLPVEHQVDAGVRAAVQTRQQHQDGEGCSWKHGYG